MTDRLSFNAARAPRKREETVQRDVRPRTRRESRFDRDLAELAALLSDDLQRAKSPSIAAGDDAGQPQPPRPEAAADLRADAREVPRRRPMLRADRAWNDNATEMPRDLDEEVGNWEPAPAPGREPRFHRPADDAPLYITPRVQPRSVVARALRVAATIFSVVALIGVSALLVLLAAGERQAVPVADETAQADQVAVAPDNVNVSPSLDERADAAVTGPSEIRPDESRIPSQEFTAVRGGGVVRAVDAREASAPPAQPAENWPAPASPAASEPAPGAVAQEQEPAAQAEAPRSARVTSDVNMRAEPDNDAAVVAIVPAGKDVGVVECTRWCEVVYDDRQGFIHKRFMSGIEE